MSIQIYFDNHKDIIEAELKQAMQEVIIAVAWINFKAYEGLFMTVLSKAKLKIICSNNPQNRSHQSVIDSLINNGAEIRLLDMPQTRNHMHHKFAVVDNKTILNGSFNWSPNAERSFENISVIKDSPDLVTAFISEFGKINAIESSAIATLQKKIRCPENGCGGERFNLLIFSKNNTETFEVFGDVVNVCLNCESKTVLASCISDTQLTLLLKDFINSDEDDDEKANVDRIIDNHLNNYVSGKIVIHAIGIVRPNQAYPEDEDETEIVWKNKFVGNRLSSTLAGNFDVLYDN